ncbi:Digeranylgeranylglyceryl phosphate synthase [Cytospora mali]|uniref:Digeranylgeranylglyceryl phosphate synthase n=1 Tax=Cytospora mali TaxID=578113 RepID=A0A194UY44_CYTMA|nr:Digeranylgeranylglyceryl phosphate synthase [Valsa mali var. pyri (nom. inval.)]
MAHCVVSDRRRLSLPSVFGEKMILLKQNSSQANRETWETSSKRGFLYHLHSLLLFTYSDIKTVIVPQAIFALASYFSHHDLISTPHTGPPSTIIFTLWRLLQMISWLWLHLLILDVANQSLTDSIAEDAINKPWRPLPAYRLSQAEARLVLFFAIPLAMALSLLTGLTAYLPSTTLICLAWLYNDLEGSSVSIVTRNLLNALGLTCFGWGALAVLAGPGAQLDLPKAAVWMAMTASIIFMTIHVQDFRDEAGDRERGRRTIALVYSPVVARGSCALFILIWSVIAPAFWAGKNTSLVAMNADTHPMYAWWVGAVSVGLGAGVGGLLLARRGQKADEHALTVWCLWVAWVYLLPVLV